MKNADYPRIRAGNTTVEREEMFAVINGKKEWNIHFIERNSDFEDVFKMKYLDLIKEKLGHANFGVFFVQGLMETGWWLCDIYADDPETANVIATTIKANPLPHLKFDYSHIGNISTYIERL